MIKVLFLPSCDDYVRTIVPVTSALQPSWTSVKMIGEVMVIVCVVHLSYATRALELNMMPDAFDDQYICCADDMELKMKDVLKEERKYKQFDEMWNQATEQWNKKKLNLPYAFKDEYGVAVVLYTMDKGYSIYKQLNGNVSIAGKSRDYYMKNFHFKAFHFYLTRALQVLKKSCANRFTTYRGTDQYFTLSLEMRFGRFASSSKKESEAQKFGTTTFFTIKTCFGADISKFSNKEEQQEVLIPVAEKFHKVKKLNGNSYMVESTGELCSYLDCAYLGGKKRKDPVCTSNNAHTRHARGLQMTGEKVGNPLCNSGTFLYSGSRPLLFFIGLILNVVTLLLH